MPRFFRGADKKERIDLDAQLAGDRQLPFEDTVDLDVLSDALHAGWVIRLNARQNRTNAGTAHQIKQIVIQQLQAQLGSRLQGQVSLDHAVGDCTQLRLVRGEVRVAEADMSDAVCPMEILQLVENLLWCAEAHRAALMQIVSAHCARHEAATACWDGDGELVHAAMWSIAAELQ